MRPRIILAKQPAKTLRIFLLVIGGLMKARQLSVIQGQINKLHISSIIPRAKIKLTQKLIHHPHDIILKELG